MASTVILLLILIAAVGAPPSAASGSFARRLPMKSLPSKERLTRLHFYFHDKVSFPNATAIPITKPAGGSPSAFGMITMMDDLLTEGPDPTSKEVGRAQGMYAAAGQDELGFLMAMNLAFTGGPPYGGSVITVLGKNAPLHPVREMPVVGGSGVFRFARGFAEARTVWFDLKTGDATVEYNVTVIHH